MIVLIEGGGEERVEWGIEEIGISDSDNIYTGDKYYPGYQKFIFSCS